MISVVISCDLLAIVRLHMCSQFLKESVASCVHALTKAEKTAIVNRTWIPTTAMYNRFWTHNRSVTFAVFLELMKAKQTRYIAMDQRLKTAITKNERDRKRIEKRRTKLLVELAGLDEQLLQLSVAEKQCDLELETALAID